jgi:hypothetical protein
LKRLFSKLIQTKKSDDGRFGNPFLIFILVAFIEPHLSTLFFFHVITAKHIDYDCIFGE